MTPRWILPLGLGAAAAAVLATVSGAREASASPAPSTPPAPPSVPEGVAGGDWTGSAFIRRASGLPADAREALVLEFIRRGAIPASLRALRPVTVRERGHEATVFVLPDVLSLGVDGDRFRPALTAATAQRAANLLGMQLPTEKIVRLTYSAARQLRSARRERPRHRRSHCARRGARDGVRRGALQGLRRRRAAVAQPRPRRDLRRLGRAGRADPTVLGTRARARLPGLLAAGAPGRARGDRRRRAPPARRGTRRSGHGVPAARRGRRRARFAAVPDLIRSAPHPAARASRSVAA